MGSQAEPTILGTVGVRVDGYVRYRQVVANQERPDSHTASACLGSLGTGLAEL